VINCRTNYYAKKYTVQVSLTGGSWATVLQAGEVRQVRRLVLMQ